MQQDLSKASSLAKKGRNEEARRYYMRVLSKFPGNRTALDALKRIGGAGTSPAEQKAASELNVAVAKLWAGRLDEALSDVAEIEARHPDVPEVLNLKGVVLSRMHRPADAIEAYRRCLALRPNQPEVLVNLAKSQINDGRNDEGIATYRAAVALLPANWALRLKLAEGLRTVGQKAQAIRVLEDALKIEPENIDLQTTLAGLKDFEPGDPQIAEMERLSRKLRLTAGHKRTLNFALGRAHDATGDHERAFAAFSRGNKVRRSEFDYATGGDVKLFSNIKAAFAEPLAPLPSDGAGPRPIFVVGMPRSGTTLLEQILGSHGEVTGAGELSWIGRRIKRDFNHDPHAAADLFPSSRLAELRDAYLDVIAPLSAGAAHVVDKLPTNFRWIGVMAAAFPDAPILHIERDPRATCWSIFRQNFAALGNRYAFDLEEIVAFYGLYRDLMAFWHDLLPGRILDISYETLTETPETEARRILAHAALDWEPGVLKFHRRNTAVRTASVNQVRREIYTGSSEEWRNYERWISGAFAGLPPEH